MAKLVVGIPDVCDFMGLTSSPARKMMAKMKLKYNRNRDQYITVEEFSDYTGIGLDLIIKYLNPKL